jgi:hypothetical protein
MIGHKTVDCKDNRKFDRNDVPDKLPAEAWAELKQADKERDLNDFREVCMALGIRLNPCLANLNSGFQGVHQSRTLEDLCRH